MESQRIDYLVDQYCNRKLTPSERLELQQLADQQQEQVEDALARMALLEAMTPAHIEFSDVQPSVREILFADKTSTVDVLSVDQNIATTTTSVLSMRRPRRRYAWWAAAALLLLAWISTYRWYLGTHPSSANTTHQPVADVEPGKEGAILTLADGSQVILDSSHSGTIAMQNGAQVLIKNGGLAYKAIGQPEGEVMYNTMTTPKGRQFNVLLPDGTRAWLNAASSLKYPTTFTGKERQVEVTGEVYFEVAQRAQQPFKVLVDNRATIEVLGTHFNVNAYEDETSIKATLLEGSIRASVVAPGEQTQTILLKPGEQALIQNSRYENNLLAKEDNHQPSARSGEQTMGITLVAHADIDKAMAWKRGFFNFENSSLEEVMRQLVRWYDIDVAYEKGVPDIKFGGELSRNVKLSGLIKVLKASMVNVRLDEQGRRLTVSP